MINIPILFVCLVKTKALSEALSDVLTLCSYPYFWLSLAKGKGTGRALSKFKLSDLRLYAIPLRKLAMNIVHERL